jgi:hypothetical protein
MTVHDSKLTFFTDRAWFHLSAYTNAQYWSRVRMGEGGGQPGSCLGCQSIKGHYNITRINVKYEYLKHISLKVCQLILLGVPTCLGPALHWSSIDLRPIFEVPLDDQIIGVWCAITATQIVGPMFLKHY